MKRVLITGGAGFVGYHLARHLHDRGGYDITLADNFFRGARDADLTALLSMPNIRLVEGDLTKPECWEILGSGYDEIYHLAGINGTKLFYEIPHEVLRIGVMTTMNALEWFRSRNGTPNAKILYTSSNEAYASGVELGIIPIPTPETAPLVIADPYNPRWSYGGQKLIGELLFINYARAYNLRMSIVRPHNFYGPRAGYDHVIPETIGKIMDQKDPFPLFGADNTRSFCYIADATLAMQCVMESEKTDGGTYHIGSTEEIAIGELVEQIFILAGWRPRTIERRDAPQGSVKRRLADVSKIKADTGWSATTPIAKGLEETIRWYRAHPKPETQ